MPTENKEVFYFKRPSDYITFLSNLNTFCMEFKEKATN